MLQQEHQYQPQMHQDGTDATGNAAGAAVIVASTCSDAALGAEAAAAAAAPVTVEATTDDAPAHEVGHQRSSGRPSSVCLIKILCLL